jgi:diacylglycerol kinase (ATP)
VPRSISPILILNPAAGQGRARRLRRSLGEHLRGLGSGARLVETVAPGHAEELARGAAAEGHDRIVVIGGDGTIQEVVNGLLHRPAAGGMEPLAVAIVPGGSGNDLARSLGLPIRTDEALELALAGATRPMDVVDARNGDRVRSYVSAAGAGFDAQVAAAMAGPRRAWQRGAIGYFVTALLELRRFRNRPMRITLRTADAEEVIARRALMVAVTNGAYYGGGFWICPEARTDDGLLDLCIVGDISRFEALKQLPGLYRGNHVGHPAVEFRRAPTVVLEAEDETGVHLDGELFGTLPVTLEARPAAVRVVTAGSGTVAA